MNIQLDKISHVKRKDSHIHYSSETSESMSDSFLSSMVISSMSLSGVAGRVGLTGLFFLNILLLSLSGPVGRLTGGILGGAGGVLLPVKQDFYARSDLRLQITLSVRPSVCVSVSQLSTYITSVRAGDCQLFINQLERCFRAG